ncbi:SpoIIE family protein phosphatase [Streptomyces jeddahensis]|uniref:Phosphoserine phosphatase RsbU n=1 Tax=Streptomyces jeddahensis TaxID=1716141 RepID=A0A177HMV7_9ACTN|nr:SpoIIE family protein phosphatase [Streptomyces jeddahensis]OAH12235.1 phosphoserine phosphatase RsbU [Streptomyces jeddahensis]
MNRPVREQGPSRGPDAGRDDLAAAVTALTAEVAALRTELARRHLLDLAAGVLMAQLSLSPSDATDHLARLAGSAGLSLEDLAADVVNAAAGTVVAGKLSAAPAGAADGHRGEPTDGGAARDRADMPSAGAAQTARPPGPAEGGPKAPSTPPATSGPRPTDSARDTAVASASRGPGPDHVRRARQAVAVAETQGRIGAVADSLLEGGLRPLGVQAVWLWRRTASNCLQLVGHAGVSPLEASHWRWLTPEAAGPLHRALTAAAPAWLPAGPPDGERLPGPHRNAARAVVPLRRAGLIAGLALAVWPGPAELDETVRRALPGLLEPASRLLDLAGPDPDDPPGLAGLLDLLAHPAMVLRTRPATRPAPSELVVEHLNEAALCSTDMVPDPAGRPLAQVFPSVHAELVRLVADAREHAAPQRAVQLPPGHRPGRPAPLLDVRVLPLSAERSLVLWHVSTDPGPAVVRVARRLENVATFEDDLTTDESRWSDQAYTIFGVPRDGPPLPLRQLGGRLHPADAVHLEELLTALTRRLEGAHTVVRVLRDDGALRHVRIAAEPLLTCGVLTGITGIYQDVSAQHHTEVALNATFDQLTTVQAQAAIRRRLVVELQQAIVPEVPTFEKLPGLQVAARYRPAAEEYQVGGDWYDVMPLAGGGVLMAVGDIAGHGIDAATGMVALRNALRGLAVTGHSPGRLMAWLNQVTLHADGQPTATAVCALYDPDTRSLRWASAGHLPLLLLREGHADLLDPPRNILLGAVPGAEYAETVTRLLPEDTLVLYTDGFIESHHMGLDQSLALLRREAERLGPGEVDEQADRLLGAVTGDTDDDTSLVVVRVL